MKSLYASMFAGLLFVSHCACGMDEKNQKDARTKIAGLTVDIIENVKSKVYTKRLANEAKRYGVSEGEVEVATQEEIFNITEIFYLKRMIGAEKSLGGKCFKKSTVKNFKKRLKDCTSKIRNSGSFSVRSISFGN